MSAWGCALPRSTGEFRRGSALMRIAWTTWSGCAGRAGSSASAAVMQAGGGWAMRGSGARAAMLRTSVTAGTIFDRTRTPLTVWFTACWLFATAEGRHLGAGLAAVAGDRLLQTAWAMLGRLRSVLVRPGRDRLSGTVQADETIIGGEEAGLRWRPGRGKKVLTGIAVEVSEPRGIGRCRMADAGRRVGGVLHPFVTSCVEPGAKVITDAWMGYTVWPGSATPTSGAASGLPAPAGEDPGELLPGGAPGRLAGQAVAAEHTPGFGGGGHLQSLPGRIHIPLQPPPLAQPRHGLLPGAGARGRA